MLIQEYDYDFIKTPLFLRSVEIFGIKNYTYLRNYNNIPSA